MVNVHNQCHNRPVQRNNLCNKDAERQQKAQALETHLTIPKQAEQATTSTDSIYVQLLSIIAPSKTFFHASTSNFLIFYLNLRSIGVLCSFEQSYCTHKALHLCGKISDNSSPNKKTDIAK